MHTSVNKHPHADLSAEMRAAIEQTAAHVATREELLGAALLRCRLAAEARRRDHLRAWRARTWVAEQLASVAAIAGERPVARIAARMRHDPRVELGVLNLAAEAEVAARDVS